MVAFKNIILASLLAVTALAAPTPLDNEDSASSLVRRKTTDKCEAHIHIDSSNGLCGSHCTDKYNIELWDTHEPSQLFGYDYDGHQIGVWSATNPDGQLKILTNKGIELFIDGRIPSGFISDSWRNSFTLHYSNQEWNSQDCANWKYKSPRLSNGYRHEFDLWCEFEC